MSLEMQGSAFVILSMRYSYVIIHELFPFPAFDCLKIVYPHRIFKKYNIKLCINLSFVLVSSIAEVCFFFFLFLWHWMWYWKLNGECHYQCHYHNLRFCEIRHHDNSLTLLCITCFFDKGVFTIYNQTQFFFILFSHEKQRG